MNVIPSGNEDDDDDHDDDDDGDDDDDDDDDDDNDDDIFVDCKPMLGTLNPGPCKHMFAL